jgi:hypothetical protein
MTPAIKPGAAVRLKPGLKNRPYQTRDGVVVEVGHDRLKVKLGTLEHWIDRQDVQL